ncbi:MAG: hypothetical protein ACLPKE_24195, partial [Streptosporangiaceae bacterium]
MRSRCSRRSGRAAARRGCPAAARQLEEELRAWARYGKPIVVTEFGADALPGLHALPPVAWS